MMFEVVNRTLFLDALVPGLDRDDVAQLTLLLKGTFGMPHLAGGEPVRLRQVPMGATAETRAPKPDTVVIEPDLERVMLCWRDRFRRGRRLRQARRLIVRQVGA